MCGILGIVSDNQSQNAEYILKGLTLLQNRGKDAYGITNGVTIQTAKSIAEFSSQEISQNNNDTNTHYLLAHNLHAIVGHVPQPLKFKNAILLANCEIYNWESLANHHKISAKNDADFLIQFLDTILQKPTDYEKLPQALTQLNGVYAFCFVKDDFLYLARDIIGEKPLFFAQDPFCFASEQKVIREFFPNRVSQITELNPRQLVRYSLIQNNEKTQIEIINRPFFTADNESNESYEELKKQTLELFLESLRLRIPHTTQKVGVLFSGGIDSTFIAFCLQKLQIPFTCYTGALVDDSTQEADDLVMSKKIANDLGFDLKVATLNLDQTHEYLKQVIPVIESSNVIKVGVALPFFIACEKAKEDGVRVMFSGLGSEEIFAGYQRHEQSANINQECVSGLRKMYERDLYRDDVLTMHHSIELRLPFLDTELISYALTIPSHYKIKDDIKKLILRDIAKDYGLPHEYANRPKKAAQYGSRFDKAIEKLARKHSFELKSQYLNTFFPPQNQRLAILFSGGKDSIFAMHTMQKQNYPICCLLTMQSQNDASYMFHTPAIEMTTLASQSLQIPQIVQQTKGEKEHELDDLRTLIAKGVEDYQIDGIVTGALYSVYQRERVEKIADELGLKVFSPLWHINQEKELRAILDAGFEVILTGVAAFGLDETWLNRKLTHADVDKLVLLEKKYKLNVAGEGGEFESLVVFGPGFNKRLKIIQSRIESDEGAHRLLIESAELE
jgi:diphthine-ammonia ligase